MPPARPLLHDHLRRPGHGAQRPDGHANRPEPGHPRRLRRPVRRRLRGISPGLQVSTEAPPGSVPAPCPSPFTISGLTNGAATTVVVRADNAVAAGAASVSASATPLTVPDAPASPRPVGDTASAESPGPPRPATVVRSSRAYTATAYTAATRRDRRAGACTIATLACSITGLTNATTYYVSVVAANAAGRGIASSPRVIVTPLARPSAPTLTGLSAGDTFLTLAYTAGSAGSSPITGLRLPAQR